MTVSTSRDAAQLVRTTPCLIVANPAAAGVTPDVVASLVARLGEVAPSVRVEWTNAPGHAADLVRDHDGVIFAVGGDGTVAEAVQSVVTSSRRPVVCALPVGSGNSTARNLLGDVDWSAGLDLVLDGSCTVRAIDLMHLVEPGFTSILGASSGFLATVLIGARAVDPSITGITRYHAAAAGVMRAMPAHPTRVSVDGETLSDGPTCSVAVGGGRFRARAFQFLPQSELDDGLLDVSSIDAPTSPEAVGQLAALLPTGAHVGLPSVHYGRGQTVVIERTDGQPLVAEFDGSVWDAAGARLTVEILPGALSVIAVP